MQSQASPQTLFTVTEAATALGVKKDYIYAVIRDGDLPVIYLGRGSRPVMRVRPSDLQRFIDSRRLEGGVRDD